MLLGPLIVFSEASPFVAENPVNSGHVGISIQMNKTIVVDVEHSEVYLNDLLKEIEYDSESRISSSIDYEIYGNDNIYFRPMTKEAWAEKDDNGEPGPFVDLYKVTETRQFDHSQVQLLAVNERPNSDWFLSKDARNQLD